MRQYSTPQSRFQVKAVIVTDSEQEWPHEKAGNFATSAEFITWLLNEPCVCWRNILYVANPDPDDQTLQTSFEIPHSFLLVLYISVFRTDKKISWICTYRSIPISSSGNKLPDWIQFQVVSCHQGFSQSLTNIISSMTSDDRTILFPDTPIVTNPTVSHSIYFLDW